MKITNWQLVSVVALCALVSFHEIEPGKQIAIVDGKAVVRSGELSNDRGELVYLVNTDENENREKIAKGLRSGAYSNIAPLVKGKVPPTWTLDAPVVSPDDALKACLAQRVLRQERRDEKAAEGKTPASSKTESTIERLTRELAEAKAANTSTAKPKGKAAKAPKAATLVKPDWHAFKSQYGGAKAATAPYQAAKAAWQAAQGSPATTEQPAEPAKGKATKGGFDATGIAQMLKGLTPAERAEALGGMTGPQRVLVTQAYIALAA